MAARIRLELEWLDALPLDAVARTTLWRELLLLQRRAAEPDQEARAMAMALERRLFAEELNRCSRLCLEGDWLQGSRQIEMLQGLAIELGEGARLAERLIELLTTLHGLLVHGAGVDEGTGASEASRADEATGSAETTGAAGTTGNAGTGESTETAGAPAARSAGEADPACPCPGPTTSAAFARAASSGERAELLWQAHRWQRLIATLPVGKPEHLAVIDEQISRYGAIAWHGRARRAGAGAELLQALRRSMTLLLQLAEPLDPCPAWIARSLREGLQLALLAEGEAMPTAAELLDWTRGYIDHALPAAAREAAHQCLWPAEAALEVGRALRLPPFHPAAGP
ncbi:MAG: hypothetical protein VKJ44_06800 [Synechococcus sp.]|nr:hypothetical protein [Synechococcus sp.]